MAYVIGCEIKVADYAKWKVSFDASAAARKAAGEKSYRLFRTADDPNNLFLLCEWDSVQRAKEFLASPELRKDQEESGVVQFPTTFALEELDSATA